MSSRVRTEIKLLALLAYVPIRYLEIIISVDMDEYKNIYVISQKHTDLREV